MRDVEIRDLLESATGEELDLPTYRADFRRRLLSGGDSWKLERQQSFEEPGFASWDATARGDWAESLRLMEKERPGLRQAARENALHGTVFHRVRVVGEPLTAYLQWELHLLALRAEHGDRIRVVTPADVADREAGAPLPELVSVGRDTLYRVLYDSRGVLVGAVRHVDPEAVERYVRYVSGLYAGGEDLASYFRREIATLPPPRLECHR
ncbi:DUF6879 family protein [Streptomyces sp. Z26]|uniref:DUF6879 family protein n=1 Tax=Streptomyces sp. Z26 TaxID=2500177 RepID=UPI000EF14B6C|nr:DUF6879 family protein [Streptomyces sp. Z26]RLL69556.1 hypothetical protein D7M15_25125 [Streptomyces sp. Z26]